MKTRTLAAGAALLAAFGTLLAAAGPAAANPYEKYAGSTIVVSWPALSHFRKAETLVQEFTDETGIEVEIDALQYLKLRDRQLLEMSKEEGEYDVVSWVVMWKGEYVAKGLLTPLSRMFTNGALVDPEYDIDDVADAYLQNGGIVGGKKGYMPGKSGGLYGISVRGRDVDPRLPQGPSGAGRRSPADDVRRAARRAAGRPGRRPGSAP